MHGTAGDSQPSNRRLTSVPAPQSEPPRSERRTPDPGVVLFAIALVYAALFALSGIADGFYDFVVWGPMAVISAALLLGAVIAVPLRVGSLGLVALASLGLLLALSILSFAWSESTDRTWTEVNRVGFYLVLLLTAIVTIPSASRARVIVRTVAVGVGVVGAYTLGGLLLADVGDWFYAFRLNEPLGYFNGEAGYLAIGVWALLASMEGLRSVALRAAALAGAVGLACLALLTQSRGAFLVFFVTATAVLLFPRRVQRAWTLVLVVAAVAAASPWLLDVYSQRPSAAIGSDPTTASVRAAAWATMLSALGAGLAYGFFAWLVLRFPRRLVRRVALVGLALLVVATVTAGAAAVGDPVDRISTAYDEFTSLEAETDQQQRFTSTVGPRYDYWRIAARAFADSPLGGLGAGNYPTEYIRERRNADYVLQPHSLLLQQLAEVGLFGGLAVCLLAGVVFLGLARLARREGPVHLEVAVGCGGIFVAWLLQTSIDWLYNIPGVTGLAMLAAGAVLGSLRMAGDHTSGPTGTLLSVAVMGLVVLLSASVAIQWTAERQRQDARARLNADPVGALRSANGSLSLNPESLPAHFTKAAALARLNRYAAARRTLLDAARKEPGNYLPWALLGDIARRRGASSEARAYYGRATQLNPFEPDLRRALELSRGSS